MDEATRARIAAFKRKHFGSSSTSASADTTNKTDPSAQPPSKLPKPNPNPKSSGKSEPLDMFADSSSEDSDDALDADKSTRLEVLEDDIGKEKMANMQAQTDADVHNQNDWDDADGYYLVRVGEVLNGRYVVRGNVGRGVFSSVVLCDQMANPKVNPNPSDSPIGNGFRPSGKEEKEDSSTVAIKVGYDLT